MYSGQDSKVSIVNLYYGNIVRNELAVFLSTADVELWVYDDFLYWKNHIIILLGVSGGVPFATNDFRLCPRDLNRSGIGATVLRVSAETGAHVGAAAVGNDPALLGLTNVDTVGTRDQDCGTWGSGEQGHSTDVGGLLAQSSQGADPRIAVFGVVEGGNCSKCHSVIISYILYGG